MRTSLSAVGIGNLKCLVSTTALYAVELSHDIQSIHHQHIRLQYIKVHQGAGPLHPIHIIGLSSLRHLLYSSLGTQALPVTVIMSLSTGRSVPLSFGRSQSSAALSSAALSSAALSFAALSLATLFFAALSFASLSFALYFALSSASFSFASYFAFSSASILSFASLAASAVRSTSLTIRCAFSIQGPSLSFHTAISSGASFFP
jgi:hypothetical protein